jgi:hypothetical protein
VLSSEGSTQWAFVRQQLALVNSSKIHYHDFFTSLKEVP